MHTSRPTSTSREEPRLRYNPRDDARDPIEMAVLWGVMIAFIYSVSLCATTSLSDMPQIAYAPLLVLLSFCMLWSKTTFVLGWLMAGALSTIGVFDVPLLNELEVSREVMQAFGSYNIGVINLGLANCALLLSSFFVLKNFLPRPDLWVPLFGFPIILVIFSIGQGFLYPETLAITLLSRAVIVGLFVTLALSRIHWSPAQLLKALKWTAIILGMLSLLFALRFVDSSGGRSMFILQMVALPLAMFLAKQRKAFLLFLAVLLVVMVSYIFVVGTFWSKLMIVSSVLAMFSIPFLQKNRLIFWFLPFFTVTLALSSLLMEGRSDLATVASNISQGRDKSAVGDLTEFTLSEAADLIAFKYQQERATLWRGVLHHTFGTDLWNFALPDPSHVFIISENSESGGIWRHGPHNGFLWLMRVYGAPIGAAIFIFFHVLIFRAVMVASNNALVRWVFQPFIVGFAMLGFSIGDYPMNSEASLIVYVMLGLTLAAHRFLPNVPQPIRLTFPSREHASARITRRKIAESTAERR